jgi:hypothetical protein
MRSHPTQPAALTALLAVAVVAVLAPGCGDSDDGSSAATTTTVAEPPPPDFGAPSGERERVVARAVEDAYGALAAGDTEAVCDRLTAAARAQLSADRAGGCPATLAGLREIAERNGAAERFDRLELGDVRIDGDRATATVSFGANAARLTLRRVDGEWRLANAPALPSPPADGAGSSASDEG